jgi:hypothetical protein
VIVEGDKVVSRYTIRGTHQGETEEFGPPSEKPMELKGITIHRFEGGKIVEEWESYDNRSVMQQLGLAPNTGRSTVATYRARVWKLRPSFLPLFTNRIESSVLGSPHAASCISSPRKAPAKYGAAFARRRSGVRIPSAPLLLFLQTAGNPNP